MVQRTSEGDSLLLKMSNNEARHKGNKGVGGGERRTKREEQEAMREEVEKRRGRAREMRQRERTKKLRPKMAGLLRKEKLGEGKPMSWGSSR